ncbi:MAG: hypothetical protein HGB32_08855 [Geobacteraceae bacterium]|nr:hypothetical protein [Geobacteraceae bacterium]NTW80242.1 hypothetical protein [Geobacteraceae bacterium]
MSGTSQMIQFLPVHAIISALFSLMLTSMIPDRFEVRQRYAVIIIFAFILFIPVFGALGIFLILIYFRYFQYFKERTEFYTVSTPPFMAESGGLAQGMGEGGAWSRLRAPELPRGMRLKALLAVNAGGGSNSSRLLQMATSDSDDEIRLLAFKLYDQREKVIGASISEALHKLREFDDQNDEGEKRHLFRSLAFSYWEMVFNELNNDLSQFFIEQSLHYATQAYNAEVDDHSLLILIGKIHLRKGDFQLAQKFINLGLVRGAHRDRVIPYLAELAYRQRDFKALKQFFTDDPLLRHKPGIGPVAKFWME